MNANLRFYSFFYHGGIFHFLLRITFSTSRAVFKTKNDLLSQLFILFCNCGRNGSNFVNSAFDLDKIALKINKHRK